MKKIMKMVAIATVAVVTFTSCSTINSGAAISSNSPIGSKMGEAKSTIIFGLWSSKGEENNIKTAAKNGGISKVSHVEYVDKSICLGLVVKHTTRVFGD